MTAAKAPFQLALEAGLEVKVRGGEVVVRCTDATAEYLANPPAPYFAPLLCSCAQREFPHELSVHLQTRYESYSPARRFLWPWSLVLSDREEPSTEVRADV
jgi:hypothetical protein